MPADGHITLRSIFHDHNRFAMPEGFWRYCFKQKSDIYGISAINGVVMSMATGFARFMYFGNLQAVKHISIPITFCGVTYISGYLIVKKKRKDGIENMEKGEGVLKFKQRVPMSPKDMEKLKENPENPFTPENLKQLGIQLPGQPDEKKDT